MKNNLREWMRLVEDNLETDEEVPPILYHGTSRSAFDNIKYDNQLRASYHGDGSVSFTTDWNTAVKFANWAARRDGDDDGIVITFDGRKLNAVCPLEPFHDSGVFSFESEWRVPENGIDPAVVDKVDRFITDVDVI